MGNLLLKKANEELREKYRKHGQEQVFAFLDKKLLTGREEDELVKQLQKVDVARALNLFEGSMQGADEAAKDAEITPIDRAEVASVAEVKEKTEEWANLAYEMMAKGQVAFIVLSGGQGTRLGFDRAKGMYNLNLPSRKTIFQLQGERLVKLHELVKAKFPDAPKPRIPWYIMTSPLNDADTRGFFKENKYFGMPKEDVVFFAQGTLPCMTKEGKFIMQDKKTLSEAPDGNGGIYLSMANTGVIDDMKKRGIQYMHVTSVDNVLVQVADPVFVGYCKSKDAQVGNKGCPKVSWDEKVGVMAKKDGKYSIVEYSEIDEKTAKLKSPEGDLLLSTGNICNHVFHLDFLIDKAIPNLTNCYHIAHKKIPYADETTGETVKPTANNGIKLEMFIFDVFPLADRFAIIECERAAEFAPVKNAPGEPTDSPDSARSMIYALHRSWLDDAGADIEEAQAWSSSEPPSCEITPLVSLRGEGLDDVLKSVPNLKMPLLICRASEKPELKGEKISPDDAPLTISLAQNEDGVNVYMIQQQ